MKRLYPTGLALLGGFATALAIGTGPANSAEDFVVAAWGDPYKACWMESVIPAFEKKHDVEVIYTEGFSSQTLGKLRAQQAKPEIDVAMMDDGPFFQAVQLGLIAELDASKLTNLDDLYDQAKEPMPHGVLFSADGTGLWYNTEIFAEKGWDPPTSWTDLFEPKFNKRIATHTIANSNGVMVLRAMTDLAGGSVPDNMDPGFAKMKELAKRVVTFDQYGETPTLIQQEAIVMGPWTYDRVFNLAKTGVPIEFVFPKEGAYGWREALGHPKGRPPENLALAHDFINMMLSEEEQRHTAECIGLIPFHKKLTGYGGEEDLSRMKLTDWSLINEHRSAWTERWVKEVERKP